ncbi:MAG TPA: hypothetical protein VKB86_08690, partial [Pyrinomonadaceae bacterium]|nr:hypothetical protein [Pyrinomonadaceae bacterium]
MANKKGHKANRIPIHFADDDKVSKAKQKDERAVEARSDEDNLSSEEIGRGSSYEDETEVKRRIDRGQEDPDTDGHGSADDADTAGGPPLDEVPERREDQDQAAPDTDTSKQGADTSSRSASDAAATGPILAELLATRAELRRVEADRDAIKSERNELRDALAHRQADFENYRKRVERDRAESYNRMVGDVV